MERTIISINEDLCDGCGLCVEGCAEGALAVIDGKARLVSEVYCDGLGACLGECPRGAITTQVREAPAYDQAAVDRHLRDMGRAPHVPHDAGHVCQGHHDAPHHHGHHGHACPGAAARRLAPASPTSAPAASATAPSQLATWPIQLRLVPPQAPWLAGADVLLCADCAPVAIPGFHERWVAGRVVLLGCPKLDDHRANMAKLAAIYAEARPAGITVLRMEVPCCGGLAQAAVDARDVSGVDVPVTVVVVGIDGGERQRFTI